MTTRDQCTHALQALAWSPTWDPRKAQAARTALTTHAHENEPDTGLLQAIGWLHQACTAAEDATRAGHDPTRVARETVNKAITALEGV